ncbi:DNA (cytosine-5-)-methyltransferase [bacterium]|nr:DNA (cytosine-5-)-methyltransferase [bacterium]
MPSAVDLYSGVGGWSLGLRMAGIDVVSSYEWWDKANDTNLRNNGHKTECLDIRQLSPASVPKVDLIVGSPPCTHFSLANRGGKGNIYEGLKDVEKFLEIVDAIKPRFWAMENVPRLASIMERELCQGGVLHRFASLGPRIMVLDASEWGVPQRRQRCIAGNFDFDLLFSYRDGLPDRTLGDVISSLSSDPVRDPTYGKPVPSVFDHEPEDVLSAEEERINREMKTFHPVYNNMSFPDDPGKPSRTVTATCTRVSRESIVVETEKGFRRLTVRERACLQSFPVGYQFYGESHSQKLKMVGNAVPPLLSFYIAQAMLGTAPADLPEPSVAIGAFSPPSDLPRRTRPDKPGCSYSAERRFRSAIPHLRFKSGVRFELGNSFSKKGAEWRIRFFFGGSKKIGEVVLDHSLLKDIEKVRGAKSKISKAIKACDKVSEIISNTSSSNLQHAWTHCEGGCVHPHSLVDAVGDAVGSLIAEDAPGLSSEAVRGVMSSMGNPPGWEKVVRNAPAVFAGLLVGCIVNGMLEKA